MCMKSLDEPWNNELAVAWSWWGMRVDIAILHIAVLVRPRGHYQSIPRLWNPPNEHQEIKRELQVWHSEERMGRNHYLAISCYCGGCMDAGMGPADSWVKFLLFTDASFQLDTGMIRTMLTLIVYMSEITGLRRSIIIWLEVKITLTI